jgi:hypothetical protein
MIQHTDLRPGSCSWLWLGVWFYGFCLFVSSRPVEAEEPAAGQQAANAKGSAVSYEQDIRPLLTHKCTSCHGALRQEAGLRLDAAQLIRAGSESGPVVVPGQLETSRIWARVTAPGGERMPPEGEGTSLNATELGQLRAWILGGAVSPESEAFVADPRGHWSHLPVRRPGLPSVANSAWIRNPIDAFIAAQHAEKGLTARPAADPASLLRRVTIDLTGIPPTREELHAFLADPSPQAYERVVDRLLDSPLHGQRWGRHWMDVWRYSDWYGSRGINEIRYSQRHIWRWRDWIVDSINADHGYDRMIQEMLAGDELAPEDPSVLAATGFLGRNWYKFDRNVWMRETVEQTAVGFLGVSLKCARCHDHKFDPISQREYYQFRAFFEPHFVRTDRLSATAGEEKDATLGMVLKEGVARVYDKELEAATFLFERGDDRYPVKDKPIQPGVIEVLGTSFPTIEPISLPLSSYFPALRPELVAGRKQAAEEKWVAAKTAEVNSVKRVEEIAARIEAARSGKPVEPLTPPRELVFADDFSGEAFDSWKTISGVWQRKDGKLLAPDVGSFLTIMTAQTLPRDFVLQLRYTHLPAGSIHSVGLAFDVLPGDSWQAVYTHSSGSQGGIQAFHRQAGVEHYPAAGIVQTAVEIGKPQTVELAVRDRQLNVWLNGELKIVYTLPIERRTGQFALWTHSGAAEFDALRIERLPDSFSLATSKDTNLPAPFGPETKPDWETLLRSAEQERELAGLRVELAQAETESLALRTVAEEARAQNAADFMTHAQAASKAEKQVQRLQSQIELQTLQQQPAPDEKKLQAARDAFAKAQQALNETSTSYTQLGEMFPQQSSGRRLALARWITDPRHPRTARVAVNHLWERHFGRGLVPSMAEFGLRARPVSHPELLDWLAAEFVENQWSMKHLHRLIVTSQTYQLASTNGNDSAVNRERDPENVYLWRANSQRMEAEVVRDSVLHLAGALDLKHGGSEIDEKLGEKVYRRSLYFRMTPNESMEFLQLFDLANPDECYERKESVVPQQSLALMNSALVLSHARSLARALSANATDAESFVTAAFEQILTRPPTEEERQRCVRFLTSHQEILAAAGEAKFPAAADSRLDPAADLNLRSRENLVHVLFSHNDFVTIR